MEPYFLSQIPLCLYKLHTKHTIYGGRSIGFCCIIHRAPFHCPNHHLPTDNQKKMVRRGNNNKKKIQILILVMASFAYRTDLGSKKRWKSVKAQERDKRWALWWVGGREDGGDISYGILVMAAQLLPGL